MIIDAHAHCGLTLPFEKLRPYWETANIDGGVLFAPVEEIYDRYDYNFTDSPSYRQSRKKVHTYLESLQRENIFTFWFVWNDFTYPPESFAGIKWHRHSSEPEYDYSSEKYRQCLEFICSKKLPIIIEEELHHTLELLKVINRRTTVIIPHLGMLNGGYENLKRAGVFENPTVYVDTALAGSTDMQDFVSNYGIDRILFGSDFPFGIPANERLKVERIFSGTEREKVLGQNLLALLSG
ncbi:MAG: amidohydrolase family protein [Dethiobacteria bacterium]